MKKRTLALLGMVILGSALVFGLLSIPDLVKASPKQDKRITITLSEKDWDIVLGGLQELPLKVAGNVYSSIMQQAQMQLQAQQKPATKDTTKKKP